MNREELRKTAEQIAMDADEDLSMTEEEQRLLMERMMAAAVQGKAMRPSVRLYNRILDAVEKLHNKRTWMAIPALACVALVLVFTFVLNQPSIRLTDYTSTALPAAGIMRAEQNDWTIQRQQEAFGWSEEARLKDFALVDCNIYSAATAQSMQEAWLLQCSYEKNNQSATVTVSQNNLPILRVLSAGEAEMVEQQMVHFGRDEAAGIHGAAWQQNGRTISVTTDAGLKALVSMVGQVIRNDAQN